jgi:hypothetical protein
MPDYLIYLSIGGAVLVFILITWIILKPKKIKPDEIKTDIALVIQSLGGLINIKEMKREHSRVKVTLEDPKKVIAKTLVDLKIPAVLKSKELTLLIKDDPKLFVSKIETMKKEVE